MSPAWDSAIQLGGSLVLDGEIPVGRDQDELLGTRSPHAPSCWPGAGDGDGVHSLDMFRPHAWSWPDERGLDLLLHDDGHPMPPHVMAAVSTWLRGAAAPAAMSSAAPEGAVTQGQGDSPPSQHARTGCPRIATPRSFISAS